MTMTAIPPSRLELLRGLEGLISEPVGLALLHFAQMVPRSQCIVELGSYLGKSAAYLATGAMFGRGAPVFCVDPWDTVGNAGGRFAFNRPGIVQRFQAQLATAEVGDEVTAFRGFSVDVARFWTRPIGLLYIDGSHTETDVRKDWQAWAPLLAPAAVVVFDDYQTERNPGVEKVVASIQSECRKWSFEPAPLAIGWRR